MNVGAWWDFRRTTVSARFMTQVAAEHGLAVADALRGTGIVESDLTDPTCEIEARHELAVVRNIVAALSHVPGLAAEVGSRFTLSNYGLLGFAVIASPTLRDAAVVGLRYLTLTNAFVRLSLEDDGREALVVFDDREIPEDVRPFLLERDLSAIAAVIPSLLGPVIAHYADQARLELASDEDAGSPLALATVLVPTTFGHQRTVLRFPAELLDERLPQADEVTARMLEEQCAELLQRRTERRGLAEQVRSRLTRDPGAMPSMDEVAAELHIDPRTLRRRLATEGTSFRALVDEVRSTLAVGLLQQIGLTVEEVASRLGYTETSSFTHAFTRWHGVPPSRYRAGSR